jgi:uncharacterized protein involved in exopolysaccharide biosynthesis
MADLNRLMRDRDIAASVYTSLSSQALQSEITALKPSDAGAQMLSESEEPSVPTQPKPLQNVVIASIVALLASGRERWSSNILHSRALCVRIEMVRWHREGKSRA